MVPEGSTKILDSKRRPRLTTKKPENQTQHDANEQRRGEWQIECKVLSLDNNVARETSEPQLGEEGPEKPRGD